MTPSTNTNIVERYVPPRPTDVPPGPLAPHARAFLAGMERDGYGSHSLSLYRRAFDRLDYLLVRDRVPLGELTADAAAGMIETNWNVPRKQHMVYAVRRLVERLREQGVTRPVDAPTHHDIARGELMAEFADFLRRQRGQGDETIAGVTRIADRFLDHCFGAKGDRIGDLTGEHVASYLASLAERVPPYRDKTPPSHLRTFLVFLFRTKRTRTNLSLCVPKVAQRFAARLPRYVGPEEIERVVNAVPKGSKTPLRSRALLLLMARLGLRAPEARAITLDDIDWREGTLLVRGKGDRHDRMPIPPDVGAAVADYIRCERQGHARALFLSSKAPYGPLTDNGYVNETIKAAFRAAGVQRPSGYVGAAVLRHSLATNLLRSGASLEEVGDVLRHRTRAATMIYAKTDLEGLRSVAGSWPTEPSAAPVSSNDGEAAR